MMMIFGRNPKFQSRLMDISLRGKKTGMSLKLCLLYFAYVRAIKTKNTANIPVLLFFFLLLKLNNFSNPYQIFTSLSRDIIIVTI